MLDHYVLMREIFQPELPKNSKKDSESGNEKKSDNNKKKLKKKGRSFIKIARRLLILL